MRAAWEYVCVFKLLCTVAWTIKDKCLHSGNSYSRGKLVLEHYDSNNNKTYGVMVFYGVMGLWRIQKRPDKLVKLIDLWTSDL